MKPDKLLIVAWFGPLPKWWPDYAQSLDSLYARGYMPYIVTDEQRFHDRVQEVIGNTIEYKMSGTGKIHDWRALFGAIYADVIEKGEYKWWGHTDLDCVYGRVDHFVTDEVLADCDIYTDCAYDYISGPFSLYRVGVTENLFRKVPHWDHLVLSPEVTGWVETVFTNVCRENVRLKVEHNHAYTSPELLRRDGDRLMHGGREVAYFHFRRTKEWPL